MAEQYVKEFNADLGELSLLTGASIGKDSMPTKFQKYNILPEPKVLFFSRPVERIEIIIQGEETPTSFKRVDKR